MAEKIGGSRFFRIETASLLLAIVNIIIFATLMFCASSCLFLEGKDFCSWLVPWPKIPDTIKGDQVTWAKIVRFKYIMYRVIFPFIMLLVLMLSGFSVALLHGIRTRQSGYVKAFWIQAAVLLPICVLLSITYIVVLLKTDHDLKNPIHITMLVASITCLIELIVTYKTYKKLKAGEDTLPLVYEKENQLSMKY